MFVLACGSFGLISRETVSVSSIFYPDPFFELRCSKQISIVPPPICFPQVEYPYKRSLFNFSFRNLHSKFHILPFLCPIKNSTASNCSLLAFSNGVSQSTHSPTTTIQMQFIRATSVPPPHSTRIGSRLSLQQAGLFLHSVMQTAHLLPFSSGLYNLRCFYRHYHHTKPTHHPI